MAITGSGVRTMFAIAITALAPLTNGQTPELRARIFATHEPGRATSITPFITINTAARFGDDHALLRIGVECYLSDGTSLDRVMIPGSQVPGQAPGVIWSGAFSRPDTYATEDHGVLFFAGASGPGIGDTPRDVPFLGSLDGAPLAITRYGAATRSGLAWSVSNGAVLVGPVDGPGDVRIPASPFVNGLAGLQLLGQMRLDSSGAVAAVYSGSMPGQGSAYAGLVADGDHVRTAAISPATVHTDRGDLRIHSVLEIGSAPRSDGSIFLRGFTDVPLNAALWLANRDGTNTLVAIAGDRAPGTEFGVTFARGIGLAPVAASDDALLFMATLTGPGITAENDTAYYLWSGGLAVLVARSRPGLPLRSFASGVHSVTLGSDGRVAMIFVNHAVLYTPGVGSVTLAAVGRELAPSINLPGIVTQVRPGVGNFSFGVPMSGSREEARGSWLSDRGEVFLSVVTNSRSTSVLRVGLADEGCRADFNADGALDFFDYADFVECFEGGRCPDGKTPDFNRDDFDDFFDYESFVTVFEQGC